MRQHPRLVMGTVMVALALLAGLCWTWIVYTKGWGPHLEDFVILVVFAPWFLVALGLFLFPIHPDPFPEGKGQSKAGPLDL